jgi:ligand-binding sensor domain-containing protein
LPFDHPRPRAFAGNEEVGLFVGLDERGLAYSDGGDWEVYTSEDGLPGDQVLDLLLVDDENLLVSFEYEVVRADPETGDWEIVPQLSGVGVLRMHQAEDGNLWFVGYEGATRYNPETGDWRQFGLGPGAIPVWSVTDIIEDEDGLWFGACGSGVSRLAKGDGDNWEAWATDDELGGNAIEAILQDGTGALWFAHPESGLSRYDPAGDTWQAFGEHEGAFDWPSIPDVDSDGHLWIGGYGELKWYDGETWRSLAPAELADVTVYQVAFGPDDVRWLWTDAGLMRHDPATDAWTAFTAADHPVLEEVDALLASSDGALWVGGEEALVRYDGSDWGAPAASGGPLEYVSDIAEAPDGSPWVVADGALYHLDGDQWVRFDWPSDGWMETLVVGPDGTVWVGDDGLGYLDPSSGTWEILTTIDGLVHHRVRAIHVTPEGVVWIGTMGGISRYTPPGAD